MESSNENESTHSENGLLLVHRLAYNGDVAAGQLAVFQGASEAPISGLIRVKRATRKNSQLAAARRVALKMAPRPPPPPLPPQFTYAPPPPPPPRPFYTPTP